MVARALREEQVEAERMLLATQSALDQDGNLLSDEERAALDLLLQQVCSAHAQSGTGELDHHGLKLTVEALGLGTEEFAARRMDRSVRSALAGKTLDQVI